MNVPLASVATFLGGVAMAISGWFSLNERALAERVDSLSSQQAATAQFTKDTDARLTRIENKLDAVLPLATVSATKR